MCLLLGASGVGKTLLVKRLQKLSSGDGKGDLGDAPPTRPTVGTNLTDIVVQRKITIRELGGCMGPIWSSYFGNCHSLLACAPDSRTLPGRTDDHFMMDAANPTQLSASCVQLLGLLSAEQLAEASVLILFNKIDLPCYMTVDEMKSLIRLPDIIACAKQNITTAEISAQKGTGLSEVLRWLQDTHRTDRRLPGGEP
ncbi:ADP-ribosylation factor-like protein 16 isoform X1 [Prionailurus viverrinus]|uniref:ADP-ribosylation factor-like protein 16 isoform X1 n=1 Tax=Prionailurus viverrinus TaxID=61388 RepID=UPI001FF332AE|nr:ADP-ribosylation factor-like protein 16 isoform X1 [Prionailurus viverrinus]